MIQTIRLIMLSPYDYIRLNHNSLTSQKKSGHQECDYKGGLVYNICITTSKCHGLTIY
jgi:hypothetical protein